jgi:translation initiation factor 5B
MSSILISSKLRSPICGIFGHVDSGKTSFLSKLKSFETVEAGGITQGVSSVFIPIDKIKSMCKKIIDLKEVLLTGKDKEQNVMTNTEFEIKIPGVLFIDTPGHEAFSNFRQKTADVCDMGIIIIDIEKGVEPQAVESIQMLITKKIPFIVVLTKLDKVEGWEIIDTPNLRQSIKNQSQETMTSLNIMMEDIKYELSKSQISAEFYFKNKTPRKTVSMIPVSNKSGEGFNDLVNYIIFITQNFMENKLTVTDKLSGFVMDKSFDKTLGWTANIILASGKIKTSDNIVIDTTDGPTKSIIRNIIGIQFNKSKNRFIRSNYSEQEASSSVTLFAPNLEHIIIGSYINIYNTEEEYAQIVRQIEQRESKTSFLSNLKKEFNEKKELGYYMICSSEDEFEAGFQVLKAGGTPIVNGSCLPLSEKEIDLFEIHLNKLIKANNLAPTINGTTTREKPFVENLLEYRTILYYTSSDKKPNNYDKIVEYAKAKQITILFNDVIYKLIDDFQNHKNNILKSRQDLYLKEGFVMTPTELKLLKQHVYLKGGAGELLMGFRVVDGSVNVGTNIFCVKTNKQIINIGQVISIEKTKETIDTATKNMEVCIKFNNPNHYLWQKDFTEKDTFITGMTRESLELMKRDFRTRLSKEDWILTVKIVKTLGI